MSVPLTGGVPVLVPRRGLILALVLIAQFMVILDATIVSVALPSIQRGLGFSSELSLQWVINAYSLAFGGFLLLGGRAGDLFGRQRLFIAGVTLFSAASLLDGLAQRTCRFEQSGLPASPPTNTLPPPCGHGRYCWTGRARPSRRATSPRPFTSRFHGA